MIRVPLWRDPPTPIHIRLNEIRPGLFSHEWAISFTVDGQERVGWVPKASVDVGSMMLQGAIIADLDDDGWLVGLPASAEMLTHGNRVAVYGLDKDRLIDCYAEPTAVTHA